MNRKPIIYIHLLLAAFFAPATFLVVISGGLYLIGEKGSTQEQEIFNGPVVLNIESPELEAEVDSLLKRAGVENYDYDYLKIKGSTLYTRPTSTEHYRIDSGDEGVSVVRVQPSLQSSLIELHKGHGPTHFKTFQMFFAAFLFLTIASGLVLGLQNAKLRKPTSLALGLGTIAFLVLAL